MTTSITDRAEPQLFDVGDRRLVDMGSAEAQAVLAAAHADRVRPLCLCSSPGVAMYIARVGTDRFVVKRMPETGATHDPQCGSYAPAERLSGLGQVMGGAIVEDPETGETVLRLGFRMGKAQRAAPTAASYEASPTTTAATSGGKLTMRAVLHYLWQEADLAIWTPGMAGKRNWAVVTWHLRAAAAGKFTHGQPLADRLYVPEPFTAGRKAELAARRVSAWAPAEQAGRSQSFMILIGELKAIEPARFGHKLIIKHLPDAPLMLDGDLLGRFRRRFADELDLWEMDPAGHLMAIATFTVGRTGLPSLEELSVTMTNEQWLPYESVAEKQLLEAAIAQRRRFAKTLRYNLPADTPMPSLIFTDTATPTAAYLIDADQDDGAIDALAAQSGTEAWCWVNGCPMPDLPPPAARN